MKGLIKETSNNNNRLNILTVLSLIGTYIGVSNLIKLVTTLAYLILGIIAIPLKLMISGVMFSTSNKEMNYQRKDKKLSFPIANLLVFAFIGNCMGVFYIIKLGTKLAYFFSAIIVCVVLYLAIKAVKSRMCDKNLTCK